MLLQPQVFPHCLCGNAAVCRQPGSIITLSLYCILLSQTSNSTGQELTRPHQVDVYLFSPSVRADSCLMIDSAQLFLSSSLAVRWVRARVGNSHGIWSNAGAADRLCCKNAGAAELWVPVAFLTAERPRRPGRCEHSLRAFKQPLKTALECLITVDSHTRSTLGLFLQPSHGHFVVGREHTWYIKLHSFKVRNLDFLFTKDTNLKACCGYCSLFAVTTIKDRQTETELP